MKLCVFQGTFNPIHRAHLQVAEYVYKNFDFDKILFIPAYKPPHKDYTPGMAIHRFNMVKFAVENRYNFDVSDIEYKSEEKSYTYLTIKELYKKYPVDGKINFIIGTDAFEKIETWYETDKLKKLVDFIVFRRTNNFSQQNYNYLKEKGYNPVNQLVGYILSEDPTYITTHNGARSLIRKVDRDDLLQALLRSYLDV